jgi:hypothetical protein
MNPILEIANRVFSRGEALAFLLTFVPAILGFVSVVTGLAGVQGSLVVLLWSVGITVLLAGSVFLLRLVRWNLISWGIDSALDWVVRLDPSLLVGIGPGGAIIAGMMAKRLARRVGREPTIFVIDRVFSTDGRALVVRLRETGSLNIGLVGNAGRVLLVTSEVHTGNTIRLVSKELEEAGIAHRTF